MLKRIIELFLSKKNIFFIFCLFIVDLLDHWNTTLKRKKEKRKKKEQKTKTDRQRKEKKIKIEDPQGLSLSEGKRIIFFFCKKKVKYLDFQNKRSQNKERRKNDHFGKNVVHLCALLS